MTGCICKFYNFINKRNDNEENKFNVLPSCLPESTLRGCGVLILPHKPEHHPATKQHDEHQRQRY